MSGKTPIRYSSTVQLQLIVGGLTLGLSHIGPGVVVLENPLELPPGDAEILMHVDGHPRIWPVKLVHGAVPYEREVEIVDRV